MTDVKKREIAVDRYLMNTYGARELTLVRGEGSYVWDSDGKKYLDFAGGIAVNLLGHCHPNVVEAITRQAQKLLHVSNLYQIEPQIQLAKLLVEHSDLDRVFFCNSGAEANEAAIKLARKFSKDRGKNSAFEIIAMKNSFHGRTLATISATGQPKFHEGFEPMVQGFKHVPFDNLPAVEQALDSKTCAILVEPIQSEGGVNVPSDGYLEGLRRLCNRHEILLIFDEVQTAMGRLGKLFGYQKFGVIPDVITMAKGLGGGVPIGAMLATETIAKSFTPGTHASTFGGNPLATSVALATVETVMAQKLGENAIEMENYLRTKLQNFSDKFPLRSIRGSGLLLGLEFDVEAKPIGKKCVENGLLVIAAQNLMRLLPPLNITKSETDEAVDIIEKSLESL